MVDAQYYVGVSVELSRMYFDNAIEPFHRHLRFARLSASASDDSFVQFRCATMGPFHRIPFALSIFGCGWCIDISLTHLSL